MAGIMVVFGTRPEAIKLIPVIEALRARGVPTQICVTAQHRELLDQILGPGRLQPDIDLDLMRPGQPIAALTGGMIFELGRIMASERPDRVIVQGDTATALAAAQAAYFSGVPVAHVEAGLRTGDLSHPHPEEGNRRMIAAISDMHFAPTPAAALTLHAESIPPASVYMTGNTVVDALLAARARLAASPELAETVSHVLEEAGGKRIILVTCHRRENLGGAAERIAGALRTLAQREDVLIAIPVHPNPSVRRTFGALGELTNVALLEPLDFLPFIALLSAAHLVLTDSGGVQEEAPVLGVPVLVLRDSTERAEGVEAGTALLVGTQTDRIVEQTARLLDNPFAHARMARAHSPYGDGRAAERIAEIIAQASGLDSAVEIAR